MSMVDRSGVQRSFIDGDPLVDELEDLRCRVRALWAQSPDGPAEVREALVMELFHAELAVERVVLRASLDIADPEVTIEVERIVGLLSSLERRWTSVAA